jgi:hypothetical protein
MGNPLPDDVRLLVAERASFRCEYCLIPEDQSFVPHQIDHIIALKHGGSSTLDNLAYSCALCNRRKGSDVASFDRQTDLVVPLFHPRRDVWNEHFRLVDNSVEPLTATGRVTVNLLRLNRHERLVERELLRRAGRLVPPK